MNEKLRMTPWNGGSCPAPLGSKTLRLYRNGDLRKSTVNGLITWSHYGDPTDIIAYRVES